MNLEQEDPPEEQVLEPGGDPNVPAEEDEDELIQSVKGADGSDVVPVGDVIRFRKQARELKKANAELTSRIAWATGVEARLNEVTPTIELIRQHPGIVQAVQQGTRPSGTQTIQPEDDQEAREWAEDYGLITSTGELDIARARRQLTRMDERGRRMVEAATAPMRQSSAQQVSVHHRQQAKAVTLDDGTKFASDESIDQAFSMLPAELTADPKVAAIIPLIAAGIDRARGKSVRVAPRQDYGDPLFTEAPAGRRGPAPLNAEVQKLLEKTGVSEKEFRATESKYVPGRAVRLE